MSFAKHILTRSDYSLFLIHGKDRTRRTTYHYLCVPGSKRRLFEERAQQGADLNLAEYGEILESGYGFSPPAEVEHAIQERFTHLTSGAV